LGNEPEALSADTTTEHMILYLQLSISFLTEFMQQKFQTVLISCLSEG